MNDAVYKIKEQTVKDIANAIRAKAGKNDLISPLDMAEEILNLPLGNILNVPFLFAYKTFLTNFSSFIIDG